MRNCGFRNGFWRWERIEDGEIGRAILVIFGVEEGQERGGYVAAEGIGLVSPVETMGATGIVGEGVFSLVMVLQHMA